MKKLELMKGPFSPKEKIEYAEGSIVSQEFIHNRAGNLTLFSFDEGQQLSEHTEGSGSVAAGIPEYKKQRHSNESRCAKADKLSFGQIECDLRFHFCQVTGNRNIRSQ